MNLEFSADELRFQQEVRQFLAEALPPHIVAATANNGSVFVEKDIALEWQAILADKGWAVPQWPEAHGGTGWTPAQKYIFSKECYHAGAPMLIPLGLLMLAPVIMAFGSEQQKREYLPKILSGEHYWCQGYSEPGAGSDLASLKLGRSATAITTSSTAARSGPRTRTWPTICSAWCAPTSPASPSRASASC